MCGVIGVIGDDHVNHLVYDGLGLLQHRGQDAAGITTLNKGVFHLHKNRGKVSEVFNVENLSTLLGHIGIGHVRYPTAGNFSVSESQPFYVNHPYGLALVHNGNLVNVRDIVKKVYNIDRRHINTNSDSEVLLNVFAHGMGNNLPKKPIPEIIFKGIKHVNDICSGGYACVSIVNGLGLVAFRDPNGIRPLVYGRRKILGKEKYQYMVSSESVSLDVAGFELLGDVAPGEGLIITEEGEIYKESCAKKVSFTPCIFEYIYFSRPDSVANDISVYDFRLNAGKVLASEIKKKWNDLKVDSIIPIPETGRISAIEMGKQLKIPYREGFIKNFYVGRTFIMPTAQSRYASVKRKLNPIVNEFKNKNVLLVDDSIVRGTTSKKIIEMIRELGTKNVYFASVSPKVKYPNVYGVDMPIKEDLIASNKTSEEISKWIGVDKLIYLSLEGLSKAFKMSSLKNDKFEGSIFTGDYITGDVDENYFEYLKNTRNIDKRNEERNIKFIASNLKGTPTL